jgi:hypothetical protein
MIGVEKLTILLCNYLKGVQDVAIVACGVELNITLLPAFSTVASSPRRARAVHPTAVVDMSAALPTALVSEVPVERGDRLFCIGNPSKIPL